MLDEILDDERFSAMMKEHVFECVEYLLQNDRPFSAMTNLDLVKFDPELPEYKEHFYRTRYRIYAGGIYL